MNGHFIDIIPTSRNGHSLNAYVMDIKWQLCNEYLKSIAVL